MGNLETAKSVFLQIQEKPEIAEFYCDILTMFGVLCMFGGFGLKQVIKRHFEE